VVFLALKAVSTALHSSSVLLHNCLALALGVLHWDMALHWAVLVSALLSAEFHLALHHFLQPDYSKANNLAASVLMPVFKLAPANKVLAVSVAVQHKDNKVNKDKVNQVSKASKDNQAKISVSQANFKHQLEQLPPLLTPRHMAPEL
jgi:hypothetical protein